MTRTPDMLLFQPLATPRLTCHKFQDMIAEPIVDPEINDRTPSHPSKVALGSMGWHEGGRLKRDWDIHVVNDARACTRSDVRYCVEASDSREKGFGYRD